MGLEREKISSLVLRFGLAFAFIYAAIAGFIDPNSWIGYFPNFTRSLLPDTALLTLWGGYQVILGLWILYGKKIFTPSILASISLAGLIVTNFAVMDVVFRDVTILSASIALAIKNAPPTNKKAGDSSSAAAI